MMTEQENIDTLNDAARLIETGVEYVSECLAEHDATIGRTIKRNQLAAESIEADINEMKRYINKFRTRANNIQYQNKTT